MRKYFFWRVRFICSTNIQNIPIDDLTNTLNFRTSEMSDNCVPPLLKRENLIHILVLRRITNQSLKIDKKKNSYKTQDSHKKFNKL